jgi:hypothetical protein
VQLFGINDITDWLSKDPSSLRFKKDVAVWAMSVRTGKKLQNMQKWCPRRTPHGTFESGPNVQKLTIMVPLLRP